MSLIDNIIVGQPMPSYMLDYVTESTSQLKIITQDITKDDILEFTYIPYCRDNINCSSLAPNTRHAISSKFSGCWMVAWQEQNEQIYAGHVQKGGTYDCGQLCIDNLCNKAKRSFIFRPSNVVSTSTGEENSWSIYGIIMFDKSFEHLTAYGVYKDLNNIVRVKKIVYDGPFKGHLVFV